MTLYVLDDDQLETEFWLQTVRWERPEWICIAFTDHDEFKEAVMYSPPDVVVLDMVMPFETGPDVCQWLREHKPEVKVAFSTMLDGPEYRVLSLS